MAHFAKLGIGNIVEKVIVVADSEAPTEQAGVDYINTLYNTRDVWKQTSYNTIGGVHLSGGTPFRKNFAGIGFTYDASRDAFIPPRVYNSWVLNETSCRWEAPIDKPSDSLPTNYHYYWNEEKYQAALKAGTDTSVAWESK